MRKRFEAGGTLSTQGNPSLGGTQVMMNVVGNSLLRQGERTQFAFGAPVSFNRYQYYGLSHVEPLGDDGATLTVGAGRLVTHPHANSNVASGTADTLTVRLSYPMIRGVHETLVVNADLSLLNSNAAFLGQAISDERTRSIRVGALYGREDPWNGTTIVSATFSQGLDVLGARRGSIAFGGPEYSKVTALLAREQALPLDLVLRLKLAGQFAFGHLPSTEQFLFGGPDIGKAFDYAFMVGDRGIGAYAELAHAWPGAVTPDFLAGSELFGYIDWGQISNIDTIYQLRYAHAASAGGGMRVKLLRSLSVEAGLGWSLNQTSALPKARGPRFIFGVSGHF
jgi:hemolysin activation/secretion protein